MTASSSTITLGRLFNNLNIYFFTEADLDHTVYCEADYSFSFEGKGLRVEDSREAPKFIHASKTAQNRHQSIFIF